VVSDHEQPDRELATPAIRPALLTDGRAAERHETQYFEMFCTRGI
jgi:hypothetical protein